MPKVYSESEKQNIIQKLKKEADLCMREYGVKKTTVDELVKRVGIPKGTFYLFYKSKELLLFDVMLGVHDTVEKGMKNDMIAAMSKKDFKITPDFLAGLIQKYVMYAMNTCMISLLNEGELEYLMSKLPDEIVAEHLANDDDFATQLLQFSPNAEKIDIKAFSGAFRAICMMLPYSREIGKDNFERSIYLLIKGVAMQLFQTGEEL